MDPNPAGDPLAGKGGGGGGSHDEHGSSDTECGGHDGMRPSSVVNIVGGTAEMEEPV